MRKAVGVRARARRRRGGSPGQPSTLEGFDLNQRTRRGASHVGVGAQKASARGAYARAAAAVRRGAGIARALRRQRGIGGDVSPPSTRRRCSPPLRRPRAPRSRRRARRRDVGTRSSRLCAAAAAACAPSGGSRRGRTAGTHEYRDEQRERGERCRPAPRARLLSSSSMSAMGEEPRRRQAVLVISIFRYGASGRSDASRAAGRVLVLLAAAAVDNKRDDEPEEETADDRQHDRDDERAAGDADGGAEGFARQLALVARVGVVAIAGFGGRWRRRRR